MIYPIIILALCFLEQQLATSTTGQIYIVGDNIVALLFYPFYLLLDVPTAYKFGGDQI
jgi:uncharacterized membrane protein YGL010W